jgi:hypothetical protein
MIRHAFATSTTFSASLEGPSGLQRRQGRQRLLWRFPGCREVEPFWDWWYATGTTADNSRRSSKPSTRSAHQLSYRERQCVPIEDNLPPMALRISGVWWASKSSFPISLMVLDPFATNARKTHSDPYFQIQLLRYADADTGHADRIHQSERSRWLIHA